MSCWDGQPLPPRDEDQWQDSDEADESWRGDVHLEGWPEETAGPEYRFYKKQQEEDEDG